MIFVYAKAILALAHSAPSMGRAAVHGHSYEVWAYEKAEGQSAEDLQERLVKVCKQLDHGNLDDLWGPNNGTMENIATYIHLNMPNTRKVLINRPVEGLGCEANYPLDTP